MKKILIATLEFPPQKGGIANYLFGIVKHLPRDKAVVLAPKNPSLPLPSEKEGGFKIHRKKLISKFPFLWPGWLPLLFYLILISQREKVESILAGQVLPVGTAAFLVKKFLGIPYFISCHGMDILVAQKSPRRKRLLNKILEQAQGVIANSQFTKNELTKIGVPENKITIIYPCPSSKKQENNKTKKQEIVEKFQLQDKKILLTVGRLVERKGHDKIIEALPKILEHMPNAMYVVVGDGPEKEKLQVLGSKLQVQNKVMFVGEVSDEELRAFYELCDVFIMVSRQINGDVEGFGTVYLEANQYGKPVVAGRSGGVAEAVEDGVTGLVIDDPTNTSQIAEAAIKLLAEDDLAKKLGAQGRNCVERKFKWEIQVKKLIRELTN